MPTPLEESIASLAKIPSDPRLGNVEARVWSRIASLQREMSPATLWGWRSAAAAALVGIGVIVGGGASAQVSAEPDIFSTRAALAPSTLLGEAP